LKNTQQSTALITGAAGFIGYHVSKLLLDQGWRVIGLDCMSNYYDVLLKERREDILLKNESYVSIHEKVETPNVLMNLLEVERPDVIIHLAAQAGVRYSLKNPRQFLESNILEPLNS
jgi:UDP-glucuronate 4-epimerase